MKTRHIAIHLSRWLDSNPSIFALARASGVDEKIIYKILADPNFETDFDQIDRIVCASVGPMVFQSDEPLHEDYMAVDLSPPSRTVRNRCKRPGCTNTFQQKYRDNRKQYCCRSCGSADQKRRKGLIKRADGPGRGLRIGTFRCGHEKAPENMYPYKRKGKSYFQCRECKKLASRRQRLKWKLNGSR